MSNNIYAFINSITARLDGGWIFIIAVCVEVGLFVAITLVSRLTPLYSLKKRAWYFVASLCVLAIELGFLTFLVQIELFYFSLAITLILFCVVLVVPEKSVDIEENHRQLARIIDEGVKDGGQSLNTPVEEEGTCQNQSDVQNFNQQNYDDVGRFELDFQHVKLVIQKLEYYPLSASDRKVVRELEESIYTAENEGFSTVIKGKINDGLGALLKIMSKHGV